MSGSDRLFFDTNAVISLLNGDVRLHDLWRQGRWAGMSVISVLEFLGWPQLQEPARRVFERFIERVEVIDLRAGDDRLLSNVVEPRRSRALKPPDAIVLASARLAQATLITRDARLRAVAKDAGVEAWNE